MKYIVILVLLGCLVEAALGSSYVPKWYPDNHLCTYDYEYDQNPCNIEAFDEALDEAKLM